jgi:hypothetical protein
LEYKYRIDLRNSVAEVLLQSENPCTYSELYQKIKAKLGYGLSHRDYASILRIMEEEGFIIREDKTGKRGSKVYYYLAETAKIQHQLRILKVEEDYEKKRSLYQILLYFHIFKRGELTTRRQLGRRLLKMGLRFEDLKTVQGDIAKNLDGMSFELSTGKYTQLNSFTNTSGDISIVKYLKNVRKDAASSANSNIVYYVFVPGFTIDEFSMYIRKLRRLKEPRPFTRYPPLVPYVYYTDYTDDEIEWAIKAFYKVGLVRIMPSVFPNETRFNISDDWLISSIIIIRIVQEICVSNIFDKMLYISKPDEHDKEILKLFFGERAMERLINQAPQSRKDFKNRPDHREETKRVQRSIQKHDNYTCSLMKELSKKFGDKLKSNDLITDLVVNFPTIQSG